MDGMRDYGDALGATAYTLVSATFAARLKPGASVALDVRYWPTADMVDITAVVSLHRCQ